MCVPSSPSPISSDWAGKVLPTDYATSEIAAVILMSHGAPQPRVAPIDLSQSQKLPPGGTKLQRQ